MVLYISFFLVSLVVCSIPLGRYMSFIFRENSMEESGERKKKTFPEMTSLEYIKNFFISVVVGTVFLYLLLHFQTKLSWDIKLNTAISYVTNTNWQSFIPERDVNNLVQLLGFVTQNFISPAVGLAVLMAVIRGFTRKNSQTLGNFWEDTGKGMVCLFLPLTLIFATIFILNGVKQNFGAVAFQTAIEQLGTNGGGFYSSNFANRLQNPNGVTNFFGMFMMLLIPSASIFMFGFMSKKMKEAITIYSVMMLLLITGIIAAICFEKGNSLNTMWVVISTATSTGSTSSQYGNFNPLTSLVLIFNMAVGEVIFGGVGTGMITMVYYIIFTMFIAGLMVGKTPEYLGKKLGPQEMLVSCIGFILPSFLVLGFCSILFLFGNMKEIMQEVGPHGVTAILYNFLSASGNNGSSFGAINLNSVFLNNLLSLLMLIGRFLSIVPGIMLAGLLVEKNEAMNNSFSFPTTGITFIFILTFLILIIGALTFFPTMILGPILEHLNNLPIGRV